MADQVQTELHDGIAVLALHRPPSNPLTPELRQALASALERALADDMARGIVLTGAGQGFSAGVDLAEFNGDLSKPWVSDLCTMIEMADKPVVAALHGITVGAGLELAMAAHARVAQNTTRIAMPDVKLGMSPGAGATQRLPRLLGAQRALEILLSGQVFQAADPRLSRLITQLTEAHPLEAACSLARSLAEKGHWPRSRDEDQGLSDPAGFQTALASIRAQVPEPGSAAAGILRCVEAAQLLPFEQGLAFETALFEERLAAPAARAARHFLMAEKFAAAPPKGANVRNVAVRQIAILGRQAKLGGLALMLLTAGYGISVVSAENAEAQAFGAWLARAMQHEVKAGRFSQEGMQKHLSLLECSADPAALSKVDLVIDDASHPMTTPPELTAHAIWAVLEQGAEARARGQALKLSKPPLGLHLYQPMNTRPIVELSCDEQHDPADVAALMAVFRRAKRATVLTTAQSGTLRRDLSAALYGAALELARHGVAPYKVDAAARKAGFDAGPFELMDRAGLPQVQARLGHYLNRHGVPTSALQPLAKMIKAGRAGRSAGHGFYSYSTNARSEDASLASFLPTPRGDSAGAKMNAGLIGSALTGAVINEAVRLIRAGRVRRAADIDLVMVKGFGFDRALGGLLLQADMRGVFYLYRDMQRLEPLSPLWAAEPKIVEMVKQGEGFFGRSVG